MTSCALHRRFRSHLSRHLADLEIEEHARGAMYVASGVKQ